MVINLFKLSYQQIVASFFQVDVSAASNRFNVSYIFPFHRFCLSLNKLFQKICHLL